MITPKDGATGRIAERYQDVSPPRGRPDATVTRAVDRRTGGAVLVYRRRGFGASSVTARRAAARRAAQLDHPALAPVLEVAVEGDELVVVEAEVPGRGLGDVAADTPSRRFGDTAADLPGQGRADTTAGGRGQGRADATGGRGRRLGGSAADLRDRGWADATAGGRGRLAVDVLASLADALDALHACGLAHGAVGCDSVVVARWAAGVERAVLLGPPDPDADPRLDRHQLLAAATLLCGTEAVHAVATAEHEPPSCAVLIHSLARTLAAPPPAPPPPRWHRLITRCRLATTSVQTLVARGPK